MKIATLIPFLVGITKKEIAHQLDLRGYGFNFSTERGLTSYNNYDRDELIQIAIDHDIDIVGDMHPKRSDAAWVLNYATLWERGKYKSNDSLTRTGKPNVTVYRLIVNRADDREDDKQYEGTLDNIDPYLPEGFREILLKQIDGQTGHYFTLKMTSSVTLLSYEISVMN